MFDGERHIIGGHVASLLQKSDYGVLSGPGIMCMLRELYSGEDGGLYMRPIKEIVALYTTTVLDLADRPAPNALRGNWDYSVGVLVNQPDFYYARTHCSFDVPDSYMMQCRIEMVQEDTTLTVGFREQTGQNQAPYRLHIRPRTNEVEIEGPGLAFPRYCPINQSKTVAIQAFLQGDMIECFVNDAHAFTMRAFDFPTGRLSFDVTNGTIRIQDLKVKTTDEQLIMATATSPFRPRWMEPH